MKTAKKNNELIALGDNQVLRSIRKIKGRNVVKSEEGFIDVKTQIVEM